MKFFGAVILTSALLLGSGCSQFSTSTPSAIPSKSVAGSTAAKPIEQPKLVGNFPIAYDKGRNVLSATSNGEFVWITFTTAETGNDSVWGRVIKIDKTGAIVDDDNIGGFPLSVTNTGDRLWFAFGSAENLSSITAANVVQAYDLNADPLTAINIANPLKVITAINAKTVSSTSSQPESGTAEPSPDIPRSNTLHKPTNATNQIWVLAQPIPGALTLAAVTGETLAAPIALPENLAIAGDNAVAVCPSGELLLALIDRTKPGSLAIHHMTGATTESLIKLPTAAAASLTCDDEESRVLINNGFQSGIATLPKKPSDGLTDYQPIELSDSATIYGSGAVSWLVDSTAGSTSIRLIGQKNRTSQPRNVPGQLLTATATGNTLYLVLAGSAPQTWTLAAISTS